MANSPMVVVWPSRGADGNYNSVTLSQRKAPYETMPKPDPHPPFTARLSKIDTWVRFNDPFFVRVDVLNFLRSQITLENPQITFARPVSTG